MKGFNSLPSFGEEKAESKASPKQPIEHSKSFSTLANSESKNGAEPSPSPFSLSKHSHSGKPNRTKRVIEKETKGSGLKKLRKRPIIPSAPYPYHTISPSITNTLPTKEIVIQAAPNPEKPPKMNWLSVLATPVGMILIMVIMILVTGTMSSSYFIFMLPMSLIGVVVAVINYRGQKKEMSVSASEKEEKYLAYLATKEQEIIDVVKAQQRIKNKDNPPADYCASMHENSVELWNRNVGGSKFLDVRIGVGDEPLCVNVKVPERRYDQENLLDNKARFIAEKSSYVSNIPKTINLKECPSLGIIGNRRNVISQAIALLVNATALHSYEDLKIVVLYSKAEQAIWEEVRWLPHIFDEKRKNRFISDNPAEAKALLGMLEQIVEDRADASFKSPWKNTTAEPHYLVIVTDMSLIKGSHISHHLTLNDPSISVSSVFLADDITKLPPKVQCIVEANDDKSIVYKASAHDLQTEFVPDRITNAEFAAYCRKMAAIRIEGAKVAKELPTFFSFLDAWQVQSPEELPIANNWQNSFPSHSMEVPLGAGLDGEIFMFDDHRDVHGVHGMYVGTTGSGKTSMVRSWILSMAVQFSPKYVNFVLVDFKGSGLIDGLEKLPHVVGTISNLDSDIRRNLTALESEIERREAFFKETGGNIYNCYKAGNTKMPFLFIVIDELAEFQTWAHSSDDNRMTLLNHISAVGNSLGIQLLAGSQTTSPFTEQMEKNARFRWCLKTATADDSMYLLKTDDAFGITEKGRAIVRVGSNEVYEEVQPAYSDGWYMTPDELSEIPQKEMALLNLRGERSGVNIDDFVHSKSQLEATVEQICAVAKDLHISEVRKIWPNRLPKTIYLRDLAQPKEGSLAFTVGLVDDPKAQRQYVLQIDIVHNGHVIVYGAPRGGKTTFLRTAVLSLLSHCGPDNIEVYLLGSGLKVFADCPQVKKSADSFSAKPVIAAVHNELMRRKKVGISADDQPVILFIDGIGEVMPDYKTELMNIAQYGAGCKVYIIASAGKLGDVAAISPYLTHGYALWFADNMFDYRSALAEKSLDRMPPKEISGRGIFFAERTLEYQTALPFSSNDELDEIIAAIRKKYPHRASSSAALSLSAGDVIVGEGKESECAVIHNFRQNSSLLVLCNNAYKRKQQLHRLARAIQEQPDVFNIIGIDVEPSTYADIPNMTFLQSGNEVDEYLAGMFSEVKRRSELQKQEGTLQFPKFIFVISDWKMCINSATELSQRRFAINVLQKGKILGIQLIAGCSYEDFKYEFDNDSIGATQLLGTGSALFVDCLGNDIPVCYSNQLKKADKNYGDLYVTSDNAEPIELLTGK